ncbi:MAG: dephospho-CoA kinase [Opitutae bacterium]|nr:dephospho-CoA kinase [Opitutae bacterium]
MLLGLTGGIGCGKSTAACMFEQFGFRRIDADALVREEILPDPAVIARIRERFGPTVVTAAGTIDRPRLADMVFVDDAARQWLEELIHPQVRARWQARVQTAPEAAWVIEIPLLFEKGLENWFDFVVCVSCAPDLQLARLERRGLARELAVQRISKQLPLARKIELSDFVLSNDGTTDFLREQISHLVTRIGVTR